MTLRRYSILGALVLVGALAFFPLKANLGSEDKEKIEKIVHDYIVTNPEVIKEALSVLQQKEAKAQSDATIQTIKEKSQAIFESDSPALEQENATITVVEFFDYQCKYCHKMRGVLESVLEKNTDVKLVYKDLPVLGGHSITAAKAALASMNQGKYLEFHKALMTQKTKLNTKKIMEVAVSVGLDPEQLAMDMKEAKVEDTIQANAKLAQDLGIRGIPALIIGNPNNLEKMDPLFFPGSVTAEQLQKAIDSLRES